MTTSSRKILHPVFRQVMCPFALAFRTPHIEINHCPVVLRPFPPGVRNPFCTHNPSPHLLDVHKQILPLRWHLVMAYFMIDLLESELQHASLFYDRCLLFGPCSPPLKKKTTDMLYPTISLKPPSRHISVVRSITPSVCDPRPNCVANLATSSSDTAFPSSEKRCFYSLCGASHNKSPILVRKEELEFHLTPRHSHSFSREGPQCAHEWLVKS